jgi:putative nucleotidyltransferase with HDIG domain
MENELDNLILTGEETFNILLGIKNLPSIPKVMLEVQALLRSESHNTVKLSGIVGKDQGLTTKILMIANSPLYGLQRKVSSLEFAIMLLGVNEVSNIVTALSLAEAIKVDNVKGLNFMEFWTHSMMVGTAAKDIAKRLGFFDLSGDAFVGGMLHDLGIQLTARYFPEQFAKIVETVSNEGMNFQEAEVKYLGLSHQEIGGFISRKWNLPPHLINSLMFHHNPYGAMDSPIVPYIVHIADCMTQKFEVANVLWDTGLEFDKSVINVLKFDGEEKFNEFVADYEVMFRETADSIKL